MDYEEVLLYNVEKQESEIIKHPIFRVYILMKGDEIIYVGCTSRLKDRINQHKTNKDFDSYIIYSKEYD